MEFEQHTLANGIRLVHKRDDSPVAYCGITINTGSRDELEHEHGLAHLIEHLLFKGTKKRKAYHVLSRMEDVGSEINAFTTKEETCIYTAFFNNYYDRALELMSDILFNSVFPQKELEKEKEVVLDEINSYLDSPSELIFDEFEQLVFDGNSIGRNILGEEKYLKTFTRQHILDFLQNNYFTSQMVISSVGNIPFDKLVKVTEKYFGDVPEKKAVNKRTYGNNYQPFYEVAEKNTYQTHCIIGNLGYNAANENRYALFLLNNLLGGPGLNSRLSMSLREKIGCAYNVDSSYSSYSDTGIISIYFGTDNEDLEKSKRSVIRELEILKVKPLGQNQLLKAKRQLIGQLAISAENKESLMLSMGKSMLLFNRIDSLGQLTQKVNEITAEQIQATANDIFNTDKLSYLIYQ